MKNLLCILFLFTATLAYSQSVTVTGIVKDSKNKPLPYAVVANAKYTNGLCTDSVGRFSFALPRTDTLIISLIGYTKSYTPMSQIKAGENIFYLKEKELLLKQVNIRPSGTTIKLGVWAKKMDVVMVTSIKDNFEQCLIIENPNKVAGMLKSVGYFIARGREYKTPFRVRIYGLNEKGVPDEDLLLRNLIVQSNVRNAWFNVDVLGEQIAFPANGIGISMEWLYTGQELSIEKDGLPEPFGQRLGLIYANTLRRCIRTNNGSWAFMTNPRISLTSMIHCEVVSD